MFVKKKKKIKLLFMIYLLCFTVFIMYIVINGMILSDISFNELMNFNVFYLVIGLLAIFIGSFLFTCLFNIVPIVIYLAITKGIKNANKEKLSDIDFGKYKGYYRDIIKTYSPAELSYIDDFKVDNKDIVAVLLKLKLKKYITVDENGIKLVNNNFEGLDENEKYVLDNIKGKYSVSTFEQKVIKDAINSGLLEMKVDIGKKVIKQVIKLIFAFILLPFLFQFISIGFSIIDNVVLEVIMILIFVVSMFFISMYPIFTIVYLISYIAKSSIHPYVRTKKGNEVNEMLEGLKNYLKDFSVMDKRSTDELILWDEYLIYSVLFNQNTKILKEFEKFLV